MMRSEGDASRDISRWWSPRGTTYTRPMHPVRSSTRAMSSTRNSEASLVWGRPEKCTPTGTAPRRAMRQSATGESMPEDSSAITLPDDPTGSPPMPRTLRA